MSLIRRPQCLLPLLLAAMLLAQVLGLVHGLVHGQQHPHPPVVLQTDEAQAAPHEHGFWEALFAHGDGDSACRVYDSVSGGLPLASADAPIAAAPVAVLFSRKFHQAAATSWANFEARAPPGIS